MEKVMVTGTFDILHDGHMDFFRQAREHGDFLVVVVARDETVEKVKGEAPWNDEEERLCQVEGIDIVDKAVLGHLDDKYLIIEEEIPDVICLGYDQEAFTEELEQELKNRDLDVDVIRLDAYKPEEFKSSKLKKTLKKKD